jgi:hypothetical protein
MLMQVQRVIDHLVSSKGENVPEWLVLDNKAVERSNKRKRHSLPLGLNL